MGVAAGGGLPQWNCACTNCTLARAGQIPSLTQSGIAFSADGHSWFLVNASPDLGAQIAAFPALHPQALRHSSIEAVLLTNADLDHVLGLFLLREGGSLALHATPAVRETLTRGLRFESIMGSFCPVTWNEPSQKDFLSLKTRDGKPSGLSYRAIPLSTSQPLYFQDTACDGDQSIAYQIQDDRTGKILLVAPDVGVLTPELNAALEEADAVLFDGTFWFNEELQKIKGAPRTALDMGHLPIQSHSLKTLRELRATPKIYFHINNTNPILQPDSAERAEVEAAGITIGRDGLEFEL